MLRPGDGEDFHRSIQTRRRQSSSVVVPLHVGDMILVLRIKTCFRRQRMLPCRHRLLPVERALSLHNFHRRSDATISAAKMSESSEDLYKLDLASFRNRNSSILKTLEMQEQERDSLWAALQKARLDGEKLREEATKEDVVLEKKEDPVSAPTSADLMAILNTPAATCTPVVEKATVPSRFAKRQPRRRRSAQPAPPPDEPVEPVEGFICPTCFMRAPSAEVLRKHDEEVHQSFIERATNKVLDNTGALGTMTRVATRKIRRSLSLRPQPINDDKSEPAVVVQTRLAAYQPGTRTPRRRFSLPPPRAPPSAVKEDPDELKQAEQPPPLPGPALHRSRWKRSTVV